MSSNTVTNEESNNNIVIITDETSVNVTQPVTNVVEVVTLGPQGPQGVPGPAGPSGSIDTSSLVTTSSFNTFTSSYYVDSASFNDRINAGGGGNLGAYVTTSSFNAFTSSYDQDSASFTTRINNSNTGSFTGSFTGSLRGTSSWAEKSITASYAETSSIVYVSSSNFSLSEIEVADYSNDVAVTYVNGRLKFIFGTPVSSSISSFVGTGFLTDRFNLELDTYTVDATWANNGYTFLTASIYTGSTLLTTISTPNSTTLSTSLTTSGSQSYRLEITASNPLDNSIYTTSSLRTLTLNKTSPNNPTQNFSANIQLGIGSNQIEQGATGSIALTASTGSANNWSITGFRSTASFGSTIVPLFGNVNGAQSTGTLLVTGSATGSNNIIISSTASYNSSTLNNPQLTTSAISSFTYTKIRSVRYAATATASFTSAQIENLALWTGSLGTTEITGSIAKGTLNPNNYQFTVNTTAQYIYVIIDSAYTLTGILNVNNSNANDINVFTSSTIGNYRVYKSNNLSSTSIVYRLTT